MYRGRLAPSPTGLLHIGHARTFWIAAQRCIERRGTLVLRNEDLDPERSRSEFAQRIIEDLRWLGIEWHEGPDRGGPYAPYSQSERRQTYLEIWRTLLERRAIYACSCSRKELRQLATAPHDGEDEPVYPGTCRNKAWDPNISDPTGWNWRFRVPDGESIEFEDGNFGRQHFIAGKDFGDFAVWRRDGVPAYQLAVVADDITMKITEVVRGADLLRSTVRQMLLYRALGAIAPAFFHCELVTDSRGERLAKRTDALSIRALRERGFTPKHVIEWAV